MKPRVAYWTPIPAPYNVDRFNALVRRGNIDFEAWFSARTEADRSWVVDETMWEFAYRYVSKARVGFWIPPILSAGPGATLPDVLATVYDGSAYVLTWWLARKRGVRTAIWVEFTSDSWPWVRRKWWKEQIKRRMIAQSDGVITMGPDGAQYAARYGASPDRIHYARHAVDSEHFALRGADARSERDAIRSSLGLRGITFIYVGRLWWAKGLDYLLAAFDHLQRVGQVETSLLIVGDGHERTRLQATSSDRGIQNVIFAGFTGKDELPSLYAASDVFVFPTLGDTYGMVVDEAMACSLPVISTCAAGEIRERVGEGVNGFIVPPRDPLRMFERMLLLAQNSDLRRRMGAESYKRIQLHTPERWATDFEAAIDRILAMPPRARSA